MHPENFVSIRVWGDFACFTRPEMKVERVSYPAITPSAAPGRACTKNCCSDTLEGN